VTYPPLDALSPLGPAAVFPNLSAIRDVNLYVHVPFCEMSCAFCPYETRLISDSNSNIDRYLRALTTEMDLIGDNLRNAEVRSLYIGGGTATVLSEMQLETLLKDLRKRFAFSPDAVRAFREGDVDLVVDHPAARARARLSAEARAELRADLAP